MDRDFHFLQFILCLRARSAVHLHAARAQLLNVRDANLGAAGHVELAQWQAHQSAQVLRRAATLVSGAADSAICLRGERTANRKQGGRWRRQRGWRNRKLGAEARVQGLQRHAAAQHGHAAQLRTGRHVQLAQPAQLRQRLEACRPRPYQTTVRRGRAAARARPRPRATPHSPHRAVRCSR